MLPLTPSHICGYYLNEDDYIFVRESVSILKSIYYYSISYLLANSEIKHEMKASK